MSSISDLCSLGLNCSFPLEKKMSVDIAKWPKGANYPWFRAALLDYFQNGVTLESYSSRFQLCLLEFLFVCVCHCPLPALPSFPEPFLPSYEIGHQPHCGACLVQSLLQIGLFSGKHCCPRACDAFMGFVFSNGFIFILNWVLFFNPFSKVYFQCIYYN